MHILAGHVYIHIYIYINAWHVNIHIYIYIYIYKYAYAHTFRGLSVYLLVFVCTLYLCAHNTIPTMFTIQYVNTGIYAHTYTRIRKNKQTNKQRKKETYQMFDAPNTWLRADYVPIITRGEYMASMWCAVTLRTGQSHEAIRLASGR